MGWILMQLDDDPKSQAATKQLEEGGAYLFDISKKDARLIPIEFGSLCSTTMEQKYHSSVGEAACDCWAIDQNRMHL